MVAQSSAVVRRYIEETGLPFNILVDESRDVLQGLRRLAPPRPRRLEHRAAGAVPDRQLRQDPLLVHRRLAGGVSVAGGNLRGARLRLGGVSRSPRRSLGGIAARRFRRSTSGRLAPRAARQALPLPRVKHATLRARALLPWLVQLDSLTVWLPTATRTHRLTPPARQPHVAPSARHGEGRRCGERLPRDA